MSSSSASSSAAGDAGSTVWPSDSSSRAASSAAATQSGSVGAIPAGASVRSADAQPIPGRRRPRRAYGRAGGGAVYGVAGHVALEHVEDAALSRTAG